MNPDLQHLFDELESRCEEMSEAFEPYKGLHAVNNAIQDIKDYLQGKDITDPQRKCTDTTHHFKGCDCW